MIAFREFLLHFTIIAVCGAEIVFKSPSMGEVVGPGPYKIRATDSGIVPTLEQFDHASWEVVLFTGNDTTPVQLFDYKLSGYKMSDPTTQSPPVNIRNNSAPSLENKFFFGYRSYLTSNESIWVTAYSDRFTLTNMTGTLPDKVVAANNNVKSMSAPYRTISCGAKSGRECDPKLLESLGLGAVTGDSASVSSTTATTDTTAATATTATTATTAATAATGSTAINLNSTAGLVNTNTTSSKKMSGGAVAGIVVGAVTAVSITIAAAVFLVKRARKRRMSKGEMMINDMNVTGQEPGAFHQKDTYGGVTKNNEIKNASRRAEMDSDRTYEMSGDHHGVVEMPGSS
ncbi:2d15dd13-2e8d-4e33-b9fd-f62ab3a0a927 [Sclerotinia trifoliorum]|uniref:2d15dd13-2e8d-4e33-b9fd-f62ab3a0a927 n=1 Tax=Sclerotinia trifoliorum TaxID=28548 RepID=A0A8H2VZV9_9HELO|nr:2d15dd13-2e8d-4e33-b9fd-f62ab3a0a927 [Sclerotinia trifoliorum]